MISCEGFRNDDHDDAVPSFVCCLDICQNYNGYQICDGGSGACVLDGESRADGARRDFHAKSGVVGGNSQNSNRNDDMDTAVAESLEKASASHAGKCGCCETYDVHVPRTKMTFAASKNEFQNYGQTRQRRSHSH